MCGAGSVTFGASGSCAEPPPPDMRPDADAGLPSAANDASAPAEAVCSVNASGTHLYVARIGLQDFRSYRSAQVESDGRPVVLTGPNGAGKTNLLEALSFLAPGRGLRRARISAVERRRSEDEASGPGWALNAQVISGNDSVSIGTGRDPDRRPDSAGDENDNDTRDRRVVRLDGTPAKSQTVLGEIVHLAWLTPEMDRLFMEGAGDRRRFLDRMVYGFAPSHAGHLAAYDRAMRERTRLLRDGRFDDSWLTALEDTMATAGVTVAAARRAFVDQLAGAAELGISAFPVPDIAVAGEAETSLARRAALDVEDDLRDRLRRGRRRDADAGRALEGPHRTDLAVRQGYAGRALLHRRAEGLAGGHRSCHGAASESRPRVCALAAAGRDCRAS